MNENTTAADRNEKVWAWANTGSKVHAFVQSAGLGRLRAMCRSNITRTSDSLFYGRNDRNVFSACIRCETLANARWDRVDASMEPVDAYDQVCEGIVTEPAAQTPDWDAVNEVICYPPVIDALHAEALAMDEGGEALNQAHREAMATLTQTSGRWAVNHPATTVRVVGRKPRNLDVIHEEALRLNREWDKSPARYAHHYSAGRNASRRAAPMSYPELRNLLPKW